jgi:hypothetical protein
MPLRTLTLETSRVVLDPSAVEFAIGISILSGMAKIGPPSVVYLDRHAIMPLPVKLRLVSRAGLQLHTLDWDKESYGMLDGDAGMFVGLQGRYKIQFQIPRLRHVLIPPAKNGIPLAGNFLECRFPDQVWRINRRDAFRAVPGLRTPVFCHVNLPDQKPVIAKVLDISYGGVGLEILKGSLDTAIGTIWPACTIRLGDHRRTVPCTLKVTSNTGKAARANHERIGCVLTLNDPGMSGEFQMLIYDVETSQRRD